MGNLQIQPDAKEQFMSPMAAVLQGGVPDIRTFVTHLVDIEDDGAKVCESITLYYQLFLENYYHQMEIFFYVAWRCTCTVQYVSQYVCVCVSDTVSVSVSVSVSVCVCMYLCVYVCMYVCMYNVTVYI